MRAGSSPCDTTTRIRVSHRPTDFTVVGASRRCPVCLSWHTLPDTDVTGGWGRWGGPVVPGVSHRWSKLAKWVTRDRHPVGPVTRLPSAPSRPCLLPYPPVLRTQRCRQRTHCVPFTHCPPPSRSRTSYRDPPEEETGSRVPGGVSSTGPDPYEWWGTSLPPYSGVMCPYFGDVCNRKSRPCLTLSYSSPELQG